MHKTILGLLVFLTSVVLVNAVLLFSNTLALSSLHSYVFSKQFQSFISDTTSTVQPTATQPSTDEYREEEIKVRGIIRKELIPPELELGDDHWYWIYFDEPYLLKDNASGWPQYIDKIQVFPPEEIYAIDEYLDVNVEIYGYQTWGYAESIVFQLYAIAQL